MAGFVKIAALIVFISLFHNGNSAKILGLMGCSSRSHHLWNEVIFDTLAKKGHTLTVVSVDVNDAPNDNLSYIHLEEAYNVINEYYSKAEGNWASSGPFSNVRMMYDYQMLTCKGILKSKGFQEALQLEEKFDLILYDMATGPCLLRFIQKYPDVPVVGVSAFKMAPEILDIFGGHNYPAYIPLYLSQVEVPMSYWQRLYNTASYAVAYFYRKHVSDAIIDSMVGRHFPVDKPSLDELYKRLQIVLVNTHPALDYAQSLPPSIIEVGGLHIKEPQELPADMKEFIEEAEKGTVLISLGTNLRAENLGEKRIETFINVINKFPKHNFLWKVETDGLIKHIPKNLMIRKWLPQNDILAHPNVKAFFTHAGGLSIQEASWYGVPVVAMPFFLDQFANAKNVDVRGSGKVVDFEGLTEKSLFRGLSGVLTDYAYRSNMIDVQQKFRARQNKPLDTAIWWIENILKNPQVDHLISPSRDMSYFVANSLDVIFIGVGICAVFLINLWIVLRSIRGTLSKPKVKSSSKVKSSIKKKVKKN